MNQKVKITLRILKENIGTVCSLIFRAAVMILMCIVACTALFSSGYKTYNLEETHRYTSSISYLDYHKESYPIGRARGRISFYWATFETSEGRCFCRLSTNYKEREQEQAFLENLEKTQQNAIFSQTERRIKFLGESEEVIDIRSDSEIFISVDDYNADTVQEKIFLTAVSVIVLCIIVFKSKKNLEEFLRIYRKRSRQLSKENFGEVKK